MRLVSVTRSNGYFLSNCCSSLSRTPLVRISLSCTVVSEYKSDSEEASYSLQNSRTGLMYCYFYSRVFKSSWSNSLSIWILLLPKSCSSPITVNPKCPSTLFSTPSLSLPGVAVKHMQGFLPINSLNDFGYSNKSASLSSMIIKSSACLSNSRPTWYCTRSWSLLRVQYFSKIELSLWSRYSVGYTICTLPVQSEMLSEVISAAVAATRDFPCPGGT